MKDASASMADCSACFRNQHALVGDVNASVVDKFPRTFSARCDGFFTSLQIRKTTFATPCDGRDWHSNSQTVDRGGQASAAIAAFEDSRLLTGRWFWLLPPEGQDLCEMRSELAKAEKN